MSSSMSMSGMATTTTSSATSATSTAMAGMDHSSMAMGNDCKISMLWNWNTIDACFLSSGWQIKSNGAFAATCIGIAALVVLLEAFRRLGKEYDAHIARQFKRSLQASSSNNARIITVEGQEVPFETFRATPLQQLLRAIIHAVVFGIAYIVMLLAMYYNGYVLFSIFIGAGLGKFFCDWMVLKIPVGTTRTDSIGKNIDHQVDEASVCCG